MIMKYTILLFAFLLMVSVSVAADPAKERGGYIGGAVGITSFEDDGAFTGANVDDSDTSFLFYGGYKFLKYFSLEGRIISLGSYTVESIDLDTLAYTLNAVGIIPFGSSSWELFGQIGAGNINFDASGFADEDETAGSAGIGVRFSPTENFSLALQGDAYAWEVDVGRSTFDMSIFTTQIAVQYIF
jgi:hypothetical protein